MIFIQFGFWLNYYDYQHVTHINNVLLIIKRQTQQQMQKTIHQHTNPMRNKRPFIKKSNNFNTSLTSKPNLSITKASHRFSLDNTFTCSDKRHESYIKTARNNYHHQQHQLLSPEMFVEEENSFTQRLSLRSGKGQAKKDSRRRYSLRGDKLISHKQKLQQILQSIDLNNSIIQQLFQQDEEISHFKQEINKSLDFIEHLHQSLQLEGEEKQKKLRSSLNYERSLEAKMRDDQNKTLSNKVEQLRKKRLSFMQNQNFRQGRVWAEKDSANKTFT